MVLLDLLIWWYTVGWVRLIRKQREIIRGIYNQFSVAILLKTLFSPWKRIVTQSRNFSEQLKAISDNVVSRFVGFAIRIFVLFAAISIIAALIVVSIILIILWPLIPIAWLIPFLIEFPKIDIIKYLKV